MEFRKITVSVSLLFWVIAELFYLSAPDIYSQNYCYAVFFWFILQSVFTTFTSSYKSDYFNFFSLFFLSYLFVNFIYPVFLFPISPTYFSVFRFGFDYSVIPKCTALAFLGSSSFGLGASLISRIKVRKYTVNTDMRIQRILRPLTFLMCICLVIIILLGGAEMFSGNFGATESIPAPLLVLFQVLMGVFVILILSQKPLTPLILKHVIGICVILLVIALFTYVGDRGPVIQIFVILVGSYSIFVRRISAKKMILLTIVGAFALTFVSYARSKTANSAGLSFLERGTEKFEFNSAFDVGMDLIVCNRNLYVGYQIANEQGFTGGSNLFYFVWSPIPMVPTMMSNLLFDSDPIELTSAHIITKQASATYGLGTNMIADLYMAFGESAVVFFMFLLGLTCKFMYNKCMIGNNLNYVIGYLFLLSFAIYLPRTTILDPLRHTLWAIAIFNVMYSLINFKKMMSSK